MPNLQKVGDVAATATTDKSGTIKVESGDDNKDTIRKDLETAATLTTSGTDEIKTENGDDNEPEAKRIKLEVVSVNLNLLIYQIN